MPLWHVWAEVLQASQTEVGLAAQVLMVGINISVGPLKGADTSTFLTDALECPAVPCKASLV